jgi:hypothetical protein
MYNVIIMIEQALATLLYVLSVYVGFTVLCSFGVIALMAIFLIVLARQISK